MTLQVVLEVVIDGSDVNGPILDRNYLLPMVFHFFFFYSET